MKSYVVTIQVKPLQQYCHVVLFIFQNFTKWNLEICGEGAPGSEMIENDSKYPAHLTPSRFPLVIVRASVIARIKVTTTSRVKMAFELAWDQAPQCGKKAKNGVK